MNMANVVYLNIANIISLNDISYFWAKNCNGLFSIDKNTGFCNLVAQDPDGNKWSDKLLYSQCVAIEDNIFIAPYYANHIMIYNVSEKKAEYLPVGEQPRFTSMCIYNDWLYFFGSKEFKRINIKSRKMEVVPKNEDMEVNHFARCKENIYVPSRNEDEIICMNLEDYSCKKLRFGNRGIHYNTVLYWNEQLILSGDAGDIVIADLRTECIKMVRVPENMGARKASVD